MQLLGSDKVDHRLKSQKPDNPQRLVEVFRTVLQAAVVQTAEAAASKLGDAPHRELIQALVASNQFGEVEAEGSEIRAEELLPYVFDTSLLGKLGLAAASQASPPDLAQLESAMQGVPKKPGYIESVAIAGSTLKLSHQPVRNDKSPAETGIIEALQLQLELDSQPTSKYETVVGETSRLVGLNAAQPVQAADVVGLVNSAALTAQPGSMVTVAEGSKQGVSTELLLEVLASVNRGPSSLAASKAPATVPPEAREMSASEYKGTGEEAAARGSRENKTSIASGTYLAPEQLMVVEQQLPGAGVEQPAINSNRTEPTTVAQVPESKGPALVRRSAASQEEAEAQPTVFRGLLGRWINIKQVQVPATAAASSQLLLGSDWRVEEQRQRLLNEGSTENPEKKVETQTLGKLKLHPAGTEIPESVPLKEEPLQIDPYKGEQNSKSELAIHRGRAPDRSAGDENKTFDETVPKTSSGDRSFVEVSSAIHSNQATNGYDPEAASFSELRREIAAQDLQQVIQEAVLKDDPVRGQKQLDLVLEPRELGSLKVKLTWQDSQVRAEVMASTREALQLLERSFGQLELSLAQKGVTLSGMSLGLMQQHQSNQEWRRPAGNRSKVSALRRKHDSITASAAVHQNTVAEGLLTSSRLNLLL